MEGQATKLKFLKRQMYGRASFDLLRRCVLLAASSTRSAGEPGQAQAVYCPQDVSRTGGDSGRQAGLARTAPWT
ncbi:Transposase [Stigmatella aurantiaca DW4/3-1]|uniref:Transposase n=1 Tax=Stigmatella aurantiaca (strain DW4/3-1) TaxID=378806 RepID=E3FSY4_STIAD|nr:Transposase [Stigmatella aurantiaca DW4/3-1]